MEYTLNKALFIILPNLTYFFREKIAFHTCTRDTSDLVRTVVNDLENQLNTEVTAEIRRHVFTWQKNQQNRTAKNRTNARSSSCCAARQS